MVQGCRFHNTGPWRHGQHCHRARGHAITAGAEDTADITETETADIADAVLHPAENVYGMGEIKVNRYEVDQVVETD